jgi:Flp pilus assembly protein TadG
MISPIRNFRRLLRRLLKDVRGGEAIEMAIVGAPFVALIFATIELGLVFLVSTTLESATDEMSRQIRTGALQTTAGSANTFKASICNNMSWLGATCAANLNIDVRSFASFTGQATPPNPVAGGKVDPVKFCWDPGGAGSVVLVRAYYTWTLVLPVLNVGLQSAGMPGKRLITTATSFRNEPYTTTTQAPATCPSLP